MIASVAAMMAAIVMVNRWAANRDIKEMAAAIMYEDCVQREYNTTPSAWYQEHGEYPSCEE